jgi:hypothetical protein
MGNHLAIFAFLRADVNTETWRKKCKYFYTDLLLTPKDLTITAQDIVNWDVVVFAAYNVCTYRSVNIYPGMKLQVDNRYIKYTN